MRTKLGVKCKQCGHWSRIDVEKVMINPDSPEPKVQVLMPSHLPLKTEKCSKCGYVIAEEKELIRIVKKS